MKLTNIRFAPILVLSSALTICLTATGCNLPAATVISDIEAGVSDAGLALQGVITVVDGILAAHPNPAVQADFTKVAAVATEALQGLDAALAGATSISDANVQAALANFYQAYQALMTIAGQLGVQTAGTPAANFARPAGTAIVYVKAPRIFAHLTH